MRTALAALAGPLLLLFLAAPSAVVSSSAAAARPQTSFALAVPASAALARPLSLAPATHATLSALGARLRAPLSGSPAAGGGDALFVFRNVTPGSYLADVHCASHAFAPLRVDVYPAAADADAAEGQALRVRAWETFRGNDWDNRGPEIPRAAGVGVEGGRFPVRVLGAKEYFVERGSFSVFGILKNPMILMGLVSMVLFIGLPKLVDNMDPEMRAEWEAQQRKNPMNSIMGGGGSGGGAGGAGSFDMAAYLAGQNAGGAKSEGDPPASSPASPPSSGNGKKGGRR
ncbi:hypothetical protein GGS23DRAFT_621052 [Durotheca rogersii]|uniref:uncharacterized protein n=1 Tax=Durotheca rogersii TaxID=419775 RepID=UPI002220F3F9|nr:uncharacterized protein GGS23DRAFT_621052 [Durotheca rogersii]KAI5863406.1 hypothetical protein GGS23DRAFT_621052 [Durotheca rogersii]